MKTYETERKELFDWLTEETEKYFEAIKQEQKEKGLCRDSELDHKQHLIEMEYNKRLLALKKKYNVK